jgi:uncharacterized protein (TIGR02646 family)
MYCHDSRGVDIDHFWPKADYPERAFVWENLLLLCTGCNRRKGGRFDLDVNGSPMLLNPTEDDPWDHLFYDSRTGILAAEFLVTGSPDPRGEYTISNSNLPLNIQLVTEGRLRTQRNIERCVRRFLESVTRAADPGEFQRELFRCVDDNDDYGLGSWFVLRGGQNEDWCRTLCEASPDVWAALVDHMTRGISTHR